MNATATAGARQVSLPNPTSGRGRLMIAALVAGVIMASCGKSYDRAAEDSDYAGPDMVYDLDYGKGRDD